MTQFKSLAEILNDQLEQIRKGNLMTHTGNSPAWHDESTALIYCPSCAKDLDIEYLRPVSQDWLVDVAWDRKELSWAGVVHCDNCHEVLCRV